MNKTINRIASMVVAFALALGVFFSASASSASVPQMAGSTYYVAVTGSDLNNCTQAAPCKSFKKAMSLVQAGDVIFVMPGTYNQSLVISKSGITVVSNGAVIDTTAQNGIKVASTAQNVIVRGFTVTRTWSHSIFVEGKFVTIENNIVYHSILENGSLSNGVITCGDEGWGSGIKAERGSSNVVIRNNTVYETCGEGIAATMSQNVVIEGNTVYDNKQINIYIDNSSNVQVLNNLSYCTGKVNNPKGIALGEEYYLGWGAQLRDVTIVGNTVDKCSTGIMAFGSDVGGILTNVLIDRNTVPSGTSFAISIDHGECSNVTVSNNLVWKTSIWERCSGVQLINNMLSASSATPPIIFTSTSQDGWVLESNETSGVGGTTNSGDTTLRVGDDATNRQYRTILSFNTASLPDNAVITRVMLKVKRQGVTGGGNPVNIFQGFMIDIRKGSFGTNALTKNDFQANASKTIGPFSPTSSSGWYTINLNKVRAQVNKTGLTQIRLHFKLDDNNNNVANFLSLHSGNAGTANRPQLIVEYYVP